VSDDILPYQELSRFDIMFGLREEPNYFKKLCETLNKEKEMDVKITIYNDENQEAIIVTNGPEEGMVNIKLIDDVDIVTVFIDDLKLALKKLTAK